MALTPQETFRALAAEAIAVSYLMASDTESRVVGVDREELKRRALLKLDLDPALKFVLAVALNEIEQACREYSDFRISQLLQPGMQTFALDGRKVRVEMSDSFMDAELQVTNILTGAALDVEQIQDGGVVIFIDSRAATTEALKRWQKLTEGDLSVMMIPLSVPKNQTVVDVVAAKRQTEEGFAQ